MVLLEVSDRSSCTSQEFYNSFRHRALPAACRASKKKELRRALLQCFTQRPRLYERGHVVYASKYLVSRNISGLSGTKNHHAHHPEPRREVYIWVRPSIATARIKKESKTSFLSFIRIYLASYIIIIASVVGGIMV
jgi:hypothetical protein